MSNSFEQQQTEGAFGFKWAKRETYESPAMQAMVKDWLFERYCGGDSSLLKSWLPATRGRILDAGCGGGMSGLVFFSDVLKDHDYIGVDISSAVDVARKRFAERGLPGEFWQMSLMDARLEENSFDMIFSEGVLHHTDSTEHSIQFLTKRIKPGGKFLFYVYAKKSPAREFTDDHIRAALAPMKDEDAWRAMESLTKLGMTLGKLNLEIDVPDDIPYLGIKKGPINLQRLFYWHFCKMYYRPELSLDEMNHINFDWFRPLNCHRQTPEQVQQWCETAGLRIDRINVQQAGITIVATRVTT